MTLTIPDAVQRPVLARDGIFNVRDLGGLNAVDGRQITAGRLVRGDSFHRAKRSADVLRALGVTRVLDLRDEREREQDGVLVADGIDVRHHPVLDPTFAWHDDDHPDPAALLAHRYQVILDAFAQPFVGALDSIVEVVADDADGAVGYHCAVGKDRTGLLTALLLSVLGVPNDTIVEDYGRSSAATAVQVSWLWSLGRPGGEATEEDIAIGVWSARPETMRTTLDWLRAEHGGAESYLLAAGLDRAALDQLRDALLEDPPS